MHRALPRAGQARGADGAPRRSRWPTRCRRSTCAVPPQSCHPRSSATCSSMSRSTTCCWGPRPTPRPARAPGGPLEAVAGGVPAPALATACCSAPAHIETYLTCPPDKFARAFRHLTSPTSASGSSSTRCWSATTRARGRTSTSCCTLDAGRRCGASAPASRSARPGRRPTRASRYVPPPARGARRAGLVEKAFTFRMGRHTLRGRVDRVDRLPDGNYELIDYKTGRPRDCRPVARGRAAVALRRRGARRGACRRCTPGIPLRPRRRATSASSDEIHRDWIAETAQARSRAASRPRASSRRPPMPARPMCDYRIAVLPRSGGSTAQPTCSRRSNGAWAFRYVLGFDAAEIARLDAQAEAIAARRPSRCRPPYRPGRGAHLGMVLSGMWPALADLVGPEGVGALDRRVQGDAAVAEDRAAARPNLRFARADARSFRDGLPRCVGDAPDALPPARCGRRCAPLPRGAGPGRAVRRGGLRRGRVAGQADGARGGDRI